MEDSVYDLTGRRVKSSILNSQSSIQKKGVYVKNGKKVVIK
jgi:Tol biopolymer transport system component